MLGHAGDHMDRWWVVWQIMDAELWIWETGLKYIVLEGLTCLDLAMVRTCHATWCEKMIPIENRAALTVNLGCDEHHIPRNVTGSWPSLL